MSKKSFYESRNKSAQSDKPMTKLDIALIIIGIIIAFGLILSTRPA